MTSGAASFRHRRPRKSARLSSDPHRSEVACRGPAGEDDGILAVRTRQRPSTAKKFPVGSSTRRACDESGGVDAGCRAAALFEGRGPETPPTAGFVRVPSNAEPSPRGRDRIEPGSMLLTGRKPCTSRVPQTAARRRSNAPAPGNQSCAAAPSAPRRPCSVLSPRNADRRRHVERRRPSRQNHVAGDDGDSKSLTAGPRGTRPSASSSGIGGPGRPFTRAAFLETISRPTAT